MVNNDAADLHAKRNHVAVKMVASAIALVTWQLLGSWLFEYGQEGLNPGYRFGGRQLLMLLGAAALSVLTAGVPLGRGKWLVPGVVLAGIGLVAAGTAYVTGMIVVSIAEPTREASLHGGSWAGHFSGVLFCLIPVSVFLAAALVRLRQLSTLYGIALLGAVSLVIPAVALVSAWVQGLNAL